MVLLDLKSNLATTFEAEFIAETKGSVWKRLS